MVLFNCSSLLLSFLFFFDFFFMRLQSKEIEKLTSILQGKIEFSTNIPSGIMRMYALVCSGWRSGALQDVPLSILISRQHHHHRRRQQQQQQQRCQESDDRDFSISAFEVVAWTRICSWVYAVENEHFYSFLHFHGMACHSIPLDFDLFKNSHINTNKRLCRDAQK